MRLCPKFPRGTDRIDAFGVPPAGFVAGAVQFAMMPPAQWHGKFVADLEAKTSGLRKPQMVGVAGLTATDQAGLGSDKTSEVAPCRGGGATRGRRARSCRFWQVRSPPSFLGSQVKA